MKVKVCGMREPNNIQSVAALSPDYMGFIFHPASPRYVADPSATITAKAHPSIQKVGVFVDVDLEEVLGKVAVYGLDMVQLHGSESPGFCAAVSGFVPVAKAFRVDADFDFGMTTGYEAACDLFVFDARGAAPGGNGIQYDWNLLQAYTGSTPFLLSGGIGPKDAAAVAQFSHQRFAGIDLNSGFEKAPANKDAALLEAFLEALNLLQHKNPNPA